MASYIVQDCPAGQSKLRASRDAANSLSEMKPQTSLDRTLWK